MATNPSWNVFRVGPPRLHTVSDDSVGITRVRRGKIFVYRDSRGVALKSQEELQRIRSLAIPPAWTAVWICPDPEGHIQATGRDLRGRKQYRYHSHWTLRREADKTGRLLRLADALHGIRRRVRQDLSRPGLPREKVLALMTKLLQITAIRPGHREYARANGSYGLASMEDSHAVISQGTLQFRFKGKSGKQHALTVQDKTLSKLVAQCRSIRGRKLFQYVDENGRPHPVHAADLNRYLSEISGTGVTSKDMRTWCATIAAYDLLRQKPGAEATQSQRKQALREVLCSVAGQLGNTPSICRTSYVHSTLQNLFLMGKLPPLSPHKARGLSAVECTVVGILKEARPAGVHLARGGSRKSASISGKSPRRAA